MDLDIDPEKIPFIDESVQGKLSNTNFGNASSPVFLEMDYKNDPETPPNTGRDTLDVPISISHSPNGDDGFKNGNDTNLRQGNMLERRTSSFKFPIHAAAEKGNVKKLERLLENGDPLTFDFKGRTPLHYACGFVYQKKALRMIDAILKCPLAQNTPEDGERKKRLIDGQDKTGETGLHIAAKTGHRLAVEKLLFSAADVNIKDSKGMEPLQLIYSKVPAAMIPVFDGAVECKVGDPYDLNLIVRLDFGAIVGYPEMGKDRSTFDLETKLLSYSLQQSEQKRSAILLHPIVQVFLFLKWKKIRILLWISILYHVLWLLLYTLFITDLYLIQCPYRNKDEGSSNNESHFNFTALNKTEIEDEREVGLNAPSNISSNATTCEMGKELFSSLNVKLVFLFGVSTSVVLKELYEMYTTPQLKFYFLQLENVGQWLLIGVVGLTSIPIFTRDHEDTIWIHAWQYQLSALGIFLAWSLILCQIGKFPRFGIYIEILGKVLKSFVMFMITFASLLVAFTLSFQILMPEKEEYLNFAWGFIKVLTMMAGEVNYHDVFYSEDTSETIPFPASTKLLYAAFVAVVTIMLFNLLIGLTVSDIQGLQKVAQLTSLSSQLEQIFLMEKFVISKRVQRWLHAINKIHWTRYFLVTQQSDDLETNMGLDIHISKIPTDLQYPIREKAIPNVRQENDEDDMDDATESTADQTPSSEGTNNKSADVVSPSGSKSTLATTAAADDLKEQIRDVLRELLQELKK